MPGENARNNPTLPAALLQATPRHVRLNAFGLFVAAMAIASAIGGLWGGIELYRRARLSQRYAALFESEAVPIQARVVRVRERDSRRAAIDYEYAVHNVPYKGRATVRGAALDSYRTGSAITVTYLASHPGASWLSGNTPSADKIWPAYVVPVAGFLCTMLMVAGILRQLALVRDGRPAMATVTKVKKRVSEEYWRVEYQWTLLSGATRTGRYNHNKRRAPEIGSMIPIVYDRDDAKRSRKYPLSLVAVRT